MPPTLTLFILASAFSTYQALKNPAVFARFAFSPRAILADKEFHRMITPGFLHLDWVHFAFNMLSLLAFGEDLELLLGGWKTIGIFFLSVVGGHVLALLIHRNRDYRAAGASGGVCGVIFFSILLFPHGSIGCFFIPFSIPSWLYGVLFLIAGFIAIRRQTGCVAHEAHLGGAITGMIIGLAMNPDLTSREPVLLGGLVGLALVLVAVLLIDPRVVADGLGFLRTESPASDERYQRYDENAVRRRKEESIDKILEKIHEHGIHSLTHTERETLNDYSRTRRR